MSEKSFHFHLVDYFIFIIMLCVSVCIGLYHACFGGKQRTTSEYLMGSRQMGRFPIAMSLLASFISSITMLGMPSEIYTYGMHYYFSFIGICLVFPIVVYIFIPTFYNLRVVSVYEYIELRFNKELRYIASTIYIITMLIGVAFIMYGPSISLRQATGLNMWWSIATVGSVAIFYTTIGGIRSVMWTDVIQGIVMIIVMVVICVHGTLDVGGFSNIIEINRLGKRLESLSFSLDPRLRYTVWGVTVAQVFSWLTLYGVNQAQVQRYLSAPSMRHAQTSTWWNIPGYILIYTLCCYTGFILYAKYWHCDPMASKRIAAPDQILPLFVMETTSAYPGLAGFFVAGVYSGSLSSISSILNSLSAVILEDFVRKTARWKSVDELQGAKISKLIVVILGFICLGLASLGDYFGAIVQSLVYNVNTFTSTILGIFILGMFFPWATSKGGIIGAVLGTAIALWISIGSQLTRYIHTRPPISVEGCSSVDIVANYTGLITDETVFDLYKISFVWLSPCCTLSVVLIGLLASFVTGPNKATSVDCRLLSPVTRFFLNKIYGEKYKQDSLNSEDISARKVFISVDNDNTKISTL